LEPRHHPARRLEMRLAAAGDDRHQLTPRQQPVDHRPGQAERGHRELARLGEELRDVVPATRADPREPGERFESLIPAVSHVWSERKGLKGLRILPGQSTGYAPRFSLPKRSGGEAPV